MTNQRIVPSVIKVNVSISVCRPECYYYPTPTTRRGRRTSDRQSSVLGYLPRWKRVTLGGRCYTPCTNLLRLEAGVVLVLLHRCHVTLRGDEESQQRLMQRRSTLSAMIAAFAREPRASSHGQTVDGAPEGVAAVPGDLVQLELM